MRSSWLLALVGLVSACSLLTPLDDLTGGAAADAQAGEAGPVEASTADAALGDAPSGDGAATSPCRGAAHAFCSDFDEGDLLGPWTSKQEEAPGSLELSSTRSRSGPRSLHARNPAQASERRYVNLTKSFSRPWSRVVIEFDLYVEDPRFADTDSSFGILGLFFASSGAAQEIAFGVSRTDSGLAVRHNGTYRSDLASTAGKLDYDQWVHVSMDFTPGGALRGSAGKQSYATTLPPITADSDPTIVLTLGALCFNAPLPEVNVYIDNVTVDFP